MTKIRRGVKIYDLDGSLIVVGKRKADSIGILYTIFESIRP